MRKTNKQKAPTVTSQKRVCKEGIPKASQMFRFEGQAMLNRRTGFLGRISRKENRHERLQLRDPICAKLGFIGN